MNIQVSSSYLQENRHQRVSEGYNVLCPAAIGRVMSDNGLKLATLSTGKARKQDNHDFQRTLSRYRGPEILPGINLDIVYDSKHMGRGVDKVLLGIYRMICTNGIFVGTSFFMQAIRHNGDTYNNVTVAVQQALTKREELTDLIQRMRARQLTADAIKHLERSAISLLVPPNAHNVVSALQHLNRVEDMSNDLWTTFNRIQENAMRGGMVKYDLMRTDENNIQSTRSMTTRRIKTNTVKDAEFNQAFFDVAAKLVA